jgi:sterol desaturase/sphingolipid hydroxylase (fatty acid hydroxylase superfamily)
VDLTVTAIPFYFGSMEAERRYLAKRAAAQGPSPADYTKPDAAASLTMGVLSLLAPFAAQKLVEQVLPGTGRFPRLLTRTAAAAAVATTVADRLASHSDARVRRAARRVASVGGPLAIGAGGLAASTTVSSRTKAKRQWERRRRKLDLGEGWPAWLAAIVGWDLVYYWNHRMMHEVRGMWAIHVVHHSSERYNLSTALRQPVADVLGVFVPYGLLARLGVRPRLIEQARGVNLLYQYWIHTDAIRRLGPGEEVLNTPSHHRVHHGSNAKYIDRNHGSILILWDRLFGTFQREEEPVVYGLTKNIGTYDPVRIASHEYVDIVRDVSRSTSWADRLSFVFRGPGWAYERHRAQSAAGVA